VKIIVEDAPKGFDVSMRAVYRTDSPPAIADGGLSIGSSRDGTLHHQPTFTAESAL
jgi:hypothetical protein